MAVNAWSARCQTMLSPSNPTITPGRQWVFSTLPAAPPHPTRKSRIRSPVSTQAERFEGLIDEVTVTSPFCPARVRVQHDTYIRASRAAVWSLMQELTPPDKWQQVAVVLANLESIYGVEYQGLAEQLLTSFQQANRGPNSTDAAPSRVASPTARAEVDQRYVDQRFDFDHWQFDHLGASEFKPDKQTQNENINSSSSSNALTTTAANNGANNQQQGTNAVTDADSSTTTTSQDIEATAAATDAAFMQLLLLLAQRAGFVPLSQRDVALGVSLNTDFLWQLFVKVSTEQLDGQIVSQDILRAAGVSRLAGSTPQLPKETEKLMVLRRGYSSEQQRGRWLLQKLDYLQLLLVKRAASGLSSLSRKLVQRMRGSSSNARTASKQNTPAPQQQHRRRLTSQRQQPYVPSISNGSSSISGNSSRNGKAVARVVQQQRTDAFGRPYPDAEVKESDNTQNNNKNNNSNGVGSSPSRNAWFKLAWGVGLGEGNERKTSSSSSSSSSNKGSSSIAESVSSNSKGEHDIGSRSRPEISSSSSGRSSRVDTALQQVDEDEQQQQQKQPGHEVEQQQQQRYSEQHQQPGQQQLRQQQRQQQRTQKGLLATVRTRAEDSVNDVLHTLSDWGVIPRMDVTPLEMFDEVYPLIEPARFQPLYIEKATLPDILDPVIEPHLKWLGRKDATVAAAFPAAGSSMDDPEITPDLGNLGQSSSSTGSLLQTLLQPVEIVEPTFRQLLVVYRKKPRQERWRALWYRLTGQQVEAAATRRPVIQLQVYRDIPLPSWQVVFPDKLLQFRPLDLLRLDLFGLAGITAALAQAKYSSLLLEAVTLATLTVWGLRLVLGFMRMGDRYKSIVAQLLAERTVAGGEGGLEYLATAAGLQQFKQAALAYVLLAASAKPFTHEQLSITAEGVLKQQLQLQVCFNAAEAVAELRRFGLLVEQRHPAIPALATAAVKGPIVDQHPALNGVEPAVVVPAAVQAHGAAAAAQQHAFPVFSVVNSGDAQQVLQQYWAGLLQQRVRSILRDA